MYHLRWSIISFLEICGCHRSRAVTRQQKVINSWPRICSQAGVCPLADEAQSDIIWLLAWVLHQWRHDGFYRTCVCCLTELRHTGDPGDRKSYLIRYDALVGRPPAPRLPPCVQVVCSNMAETGNLTEREREVLNLSRHQSPSSLLLLEVGARSFLKQHKTPRRSISSFHHKTTQRLTFSPAQTLNLQAAENQLSPRHCGCTRHQNHLILLC